MIERIGHIKNPLTIIALFAAIAEISGTLVLPHISEANQCTFIWFVMGFPLLLVILFFLTLNFNHKVLYAPSDFKDEDNFLEFLRPASASEKAEKLKNEIQEIESEPKTITTSSAQIPDERISFSQYYRSSIPAGYVLAEKLALTKLSQRYGEVIQREVSFDVGSKLEVFDAFFKDNDKFVLVEIKYTRGAEVVRRLRDAINRMRQSYERIPPKARRVLIPAIAFVVDIPINDFQQATQKLQPIIDDASDIKVYVYNLDELKKEFGL